MSSFPSVLESIRDLNKDQIDALVERARYFKKNIYSSQNIFSEKKPIVANLFLENSTRTINSFAVACHRLGAIYLHVDAKTSSLAKGEDLRETFLTLKSQGVDAVVMRTSTNKQFEQFKNQNFPLAIVNAGDGTHQHPSQALLDLLTMIEMGHNLKDKTVLIAGDCIHSRVAGSLIDLLPQYGAKILLCGPKSLIEGREIKDVVELEFDMDKAILKADILYLLRIQKERHNNQHDQNFYSNYHRQYGVNLARLQKLNRMLPVYHPGPFNAEVEISMDLVNSPYYMGYKQVEHSTFMRMAILEHIIKRTGTIYE